MHFTSNSDNVDEDDSSNPRETPVVNPAADFKSRAAALGWWALSVLLLVGVVVLGYVLPALHEAVLGPENFARFYFLTSDIGFFFLVTIPILLRPKLLWLSKLRPRWEDVIWLIVGFLINRLPLPFVTTELSPDVGLWVYVLSFILTTPILEEILFRGIFLRSLMEKLPPPVAIGSVAFLSALLHSPYHGLLLQLALCLIYVYRGKSLPSAIACHAGANIAAMIFFTRTG